MNSLQSNSEILVIPEKAELVYLSLGSNLGNSEANLKKALSLLKQEKGITVHSVSGFYRTAPVEYKDQPDFKNCAAELHSSLEPLELLKRTRKIEKKIGNTKPFRYGPRKIDIDIIFYGNRIIDEEQLRIPHPKMHERGFVLIPMAELNPEARHPVLNRTVKEMLQALPVNPGERVVRT